jgi:hypothetical protein
MERVEVGGNLVRHNRARAILIRKRGKSTTEEMKLRWQSRMRSRPTRRTYLTEVKGAGKQPGKAQRRMKDWVFVVVVVVVVQM